MTTSSIITSKSINISQVATNTFSTNDMQTINTELNESSKNIILASSMTSNFAEG